MKNLIHYFHQAINQDSFTAEEIENQIGFPCYISVKDNKTGRYLCANDFMLNDLNLELGETDYDLWSHEHATVIRNHDDWVTTQRDNLTTFELADNIEKNLPIFGFCIKTPAISLSNKIIGSNCLCIVYKKQTLDSTIYNYKEDILSKRQKECLYLIVKGMTMKQIAIQLGLSSHTVENYIEAIKAKLACNTRSELIEKALKFDFIKYLLLLND